MAHFLYPLVVPYLLVSSLGHRRKEINVLFNEAFSIYDVGHKDYSDTEKGNTFSAVSSNSLTEFP